MSDDTPAKTLSFNELLDTFLETQQLLQGHAVRTVNKALRVPPGNRLESLKGSRKGQYSIRINDQWRICFRWREGDAYDLEIVDYH